MSERPAATSHRYIASVRPTRPWKRRMRPIGLERLPSRLYGWERRLAIVLVSGCDPQVPEHGHGELRVVFDASPRDSVDGLVIFLPDPARPRRALDLEVLQRGDDRIDVQRLGLLHRLLDRVQRRV